MPPFLSKIAGVLPIFAWDMSRTVMDITLIDRQALHAHSLQFRHPLTDQELSLTAPLPPDFQRTLDALRKYQLA